MSQFDVIAIGRSGLDLYAEQVGASFDRIRSFAAYVGGTPANIAVGARRLGLRTALATAVSDDAVGDFILRFLKDEGVETRFVVRKTGVKSGLTLLGIMPPDRFERVHYRENVADQRQTLADVADLPLAATSVVLVVGTSLAQSPGREATLFAAEQARRSGATVVLDLDYRADLWPDPLSYSISVRALARLCDTAIGTQEEITAAAGADAQALRSAPDADTGADAQAVRSAPDADTGADVPVAPRGSAPDAGTGADAGGSARDEEIAFAVRSLMQLGPEMIVEKRGPEGSRVHLRSGDVLDAPGFRIEVQNTLGAGDAFASGFLFGMLQGWDPQRAARFGNACGAIVVSRHACSASCPTMDEVMSFIDGQGGL